MGDWYRLHGHDWTDLSFSWQAIIEHGWLTVVCIRLNWVGSHMAWYRQTGLDQGRLEIIKLVWILAAWRPWNQPRQKHLHFKKVWLEVHVNYLVLGSLEVFKLGNLSASWKGLSWAGSQLARYDYAKLALSFLDMIKQNLLVICIRVDCTIVDIAYKESDYKGEWEKYRRVELRTINIDYRT